MSTRPSPASRLSSLPIGASRFTHASTVKGPSSDTTGPVAMSSPESRSTDGAPAVRSPQSFSSVGSPPSTARMSATTDRGRLVGSMSSAVIAATSAAAPSLCRASAAAAACRSVNERSSHAATSAAHDVRSRDSAQAAKASARSDGTFAVAERMAWPAAAERVPSSRRQRNAACRTSTAVPPSHTRAVTADSTPFVLNAPTSLSASARSAAEPLTPRSSAAAFATIGSRAGLVRPVRNLSSVSSVAARVRGSQADFSTAAATSGRSACEASSRTSSSPSGRSRVPTSATSPRAADCGSSASVASSRFSIGSSRPAGDARNAATAAGCSSKAQRTRYRSKSRSYTVHASPSTRPPPSLMMSATVSGSVTGIRRNASPSAARTCGAGSLTSGAASRRNTTSEQVAPAIRIAS